MTAIFGYIADSNNENKIRTFLASDGRVKWHTPEGDLIQNDYKKIKRFRNLLISFNGEVSFFEEFIRILNLIDSEISSIQSLQDAINSIYDYDVYLSTINGHSQSRYSNIIVYDILNKKLAHHYAGNVCFNRGLNSSFNFRILENNKIYHFGSYTSFLNKTTDSDEAYSIEGVELLGGTIDEQEKLINEKFILLDSTVSGVGNLNSIYIVEMEKNEVFKNID
jgi:hypothetical protein